LIKSDLIVNENNALPFSLDLFGNRVRDEGFSAAESIRTTMFTNKNRLTDPAHPGSYDLTLAGQDDVSNHNLQAVSGIGGSES
jgi:hypothetical protein